MALGFPVRELDTPAIPALEGSRPWRLARRVRRTRSGPTSCSPPRTVAR